MLQLHHFDIDIATGWQLKQQQKKRCTDSLQPSEIVSFSSFASSSIFIVLHKKRIAEQVLKIHSHSFPVYEVNIKKVRKEKKKCVVSLTPFSCAIGNVNCCYSHVLRIFFHLSFVFYFE